LVSRRLDIGSLIQLGRNEVLEAWESLLGGIERHLLLGPVVELLRLHLFLGVVYTSQTLVEHIVQVLLVGSGVSKEVPIVTLK